MIATSDNFRNFVYLLSLPFSNLLLSLTQMMKVALESNDRPKVFLISSKSSSVVKSLNTVNIKLKNMKLFLG